MAVAYVDTSCVLAIAFREPGGDAVRRRLESFRDIFSSNLLEAEFAAAFRRQGLTPDRSLLDSMRWVLPTRQLSAEIRRVLKVGSLRGADVWHLASALYLREMAAPVPFITLDDKQARVAAALGFDG